MKSTCGILLLIIGLLALSLPCITFIFGAASFVDWRYSSFDERVFGVLILIVFTAFVSIPSLLLIYAATWLLGNDRIKKSINPTLFRMRK